MSTAARVRLHHVGVVIPSHDEARLLLELLGLTVARTEYVPQYEAECLFTDSAGPTLEFVIPRGGRLAQFNRGVGGLHHIALAVPDLTAMAATLRARDVALLEPEPIAAGPLRINFIPPAYTRGLIVELVEDRTMVADEPALAEVAT